MALFELYRHFNCEGVLLYVGQSYSAFERLTRGHKRTSRWYEDITEVRIERFPSQELLDAAEVEAIKAEKPLHNVQHNTRSEVECISEDGRVFYIPKKRRRVVELIKAVGEDEYAEKCLEFLDRDIRFVDDTLFGADRYYVGSHFHYCELRGWGILDDELHWTAGLQAKAFFDSKHAIIKVMTNAEVKQVVAMLRCKLKGRIPELNMVKQVEYNRLRYAKIYGFRAPIESNALNEIMNGLTNKPLDFQ